MTDIAGIRARPRNPWALVGALWLLSVLSVRAQSPTTAGDAQHAVTLADLIGLGHILTPSGLALSSDGTQLAYVVFKENEEGTFDTLQVISTARADLPRSLGTGIMPRWAPRGHTLAFYSARGGTLQLWLYDGTTTALRELTHVPEGIRPSAPLSGYVDEPLRYAWSPDGTRIAFTAEVPLASPSSPSTRSGDPSGGSAVGASETAVANRVPMILDRHTPLEWATSGIFRATFGNRFRNGRFVQEDAGPQAGSARAVNQLFVVDVASGRVRRLTTDTAGYFYPDWSPDGRTIAATSPEGRPTTHHLPDTTNIYLVDVATGRSVAFTTGAGTKRLPAWSSDGKWIAYCQTSQLFGMKAIMVAARAGGAPLSLTAQLDRQVDDFAWAPDGKAVLAAIRDGPFHPIVRLDIVPPHIEHVTPAGEIARFFAVARSGAMVWAHNDTRHQGVLTIARQPGATPQAIVDLNPQTAMWQLGEQRVAHWRTHMGDTVDGILILPTEYRAGVRYPLIVDGYSGYKNELQSSTIAANQTLAGRGYAVFLPDHRAPHTYQNYMLKGQAYTDKGKGPAGIDVLVDDILSGVDTLIAQGIADSSRMCLFGYSNGGGTVNYMITHTARFRCAVSASAAVTDRATDFFVSGDPAYTMFWDEGYAPWERPDVYAAVSPVYHLDQVRTPLLLSIGDHDAAMLLGTLEMYRGLRWLGRDVTLLRYPGQSHELEGAALEDFWTRVYAFFDQYLKAIPARQN